MRKKGFLMAAMAGVFGALSDTGNILESSEYHPSYGRFNKDRKGAIPNAEPAAPNGTKTYFFDEHGNFSTEQMLREACVFKCFAVNDRNAIRKFNKFKR